MKEGDGGRDGWTKACSGAASGLVVGDCGKCHANGGSDAEVRIKYQCQLVYIGRDEEIMRVEVISLRGQMMKQV